MVLKISRNESGDSANTKAGKEIIKYRHGRNILDVMEQEPGHVFALSMVRGYGGHGG